MYFFMPILDGKPCHTPLKSIYKHVTRMVSFNLKNKIGQIVIYATFKMGIARTRGWEEHNLHTNKVKFQVAPKVYGGE